MRALATAILDFYRQDRNSLFYGVTALLLSIGLFINYSPLIDIQWVNRDSSDWPWFLHYVLLYGGFYYTAAVLGSRGSEQAYLRNSWFWLLSAAFIVIAILPKIHFLPFVDIRSQSHWSGAEKVFVFKSHFFLHQFVLTAAGLIAVLLAVRKWMPLELGLRWDWKKLRPYFLILLMVSPLMVIASFFPDFQRAYPQYRPWFNNELAFGLSNGVRTAVFTACYSTGFIAVELLFRGAMVIGLFRIMGTRAVVPMAAFYCAFHFGKPMGEAIASIVGSYLLGVLALHGRSIAGGIIVHLGVAMLMEFMGHIQHALK